VTCRVLVTAAGGALSPLNIRLLKAGTRNAVWVGAVDVLNEAAGRYFADAFATVPNGLDDGYVEAIEALVRDWSIDLVLPWSDEEALALARVRGRIEAGGATLACASLDALEIMNDKAATFERLQAAGLRVPQWEVARDPDDLDAAIGRIAEATGEFVVKPIVARGNRGTIVVRRDVTGAAPYQGSREIHMDAATFDAAHRTQIAVDLPVMVMERLAAPAYDIDVLARDGAVLRAMPRRRLNPAGVPFTGGVLEPSDALMTLAADVTAALELSWLYDYDVMTAADGAPAIIELNPRPSGSIAAAILAGVPFYEDLISLMRSEPLPEVALPGPVALIPYTDCIAVPLKALP